jgi:membrane-associated phospholipid phosphatase
MSTSVSVPVDRRSPSDADWMIPASLFVLAQYGFAVVISARIAYPPRPPVMSYVMAAMFFAAVAAVLWLLFAIGRMFLRGEAHPTQRLVELAKRQWWPWLLILGTFLLIAAQDGALTWLKAMLPFAVPFWADPMLAAADRSIFGVDAWRLFHPLLEPFDRVIDYGYVCWFPLDTLLIVYVQTKAASFEKSRAMLASFLTIGIFGVIGEYALSSAGPIFYARLGLGNQFHDLPISAIARQASDYLWAARGNINSPIGAGISAMPSIHVASAVWMALACWSLLPRLFGVLATAFAVLIFVGSIYLGWHYFVDGAAGVAAAIACWAMAGAYLRYRARAPIPRLRAAALSILRQSRA